MNVLWVQIQIRSLSSGPGLMMIEGPAVYAPEHSMVVGLHGPCQIIKQGMAFTDLQFSFKGATDVWFHPSSEDVL
jgi:hypothetical protein